MASVDECALHVAVFHGRIDDGSVGIVGEFDPARVPGEAQPLDVRDVDDGWNRVRIFESGASLRVWPRIPRWPEIRMALYLVSYDVAADKRRTRVANALEDYGVRVQYSVFEVETSDRGLDRLLNRLQDLVDPTTDSVRAYLLHQRCRASVRIIGRGPMAGERDDATVV